MELLLPRHKTILDLAHKDGSVRVESLAVQLAVTPQTIRKDLNILCERRLLHRVHGGAVIRSGVVNYGYDARRELAEDEKLHIGARAAELIPDDCSLFINIGTTTEQVARQLTNRKGLLVISNNINVANILYQNPNIEVVLTGGMVRRSDGGLVGQMTTDAIGRFKVDYAVIGTSAIDPDGTLLDFDSREVKAAQAIIENSRHCILVADYMKYDRSAPVRVCHISQMETFVTDRQPPESIAGICAESDVNIVLAAES
ncbi:MAG: DeoR family transcriptional regulator [Hyphomicrobiales bacterium]|nr:MAG: DeoR family transcriptional regulator [Hyphomicrobiales bacterium]